MKNPRTDVKMKRSNRPRYLSRDQVRDLDRYAIETLGIPGIVLMENAGRGLTDHLDRRLRSQMKKQGGHPPAHVAVLCGKGNNGGDGFVIARHLMLRGHKVTIDLAADPSDLPSDAATNFAIARNMNIPMASLTVKNALTQAAERWRTCDALVDALLGTGIKGRVREPFGAIIEKVNAVKGPLKVAVDVPSGLDVDAGTAEGAAFRADLTVTFVCAKGGYARRSGREYLGKVTVVDIGAPAGLIIDALGITGHTLVRTGN